MRVLLSLLLVDVKLTRGKEEMIHAALMKVGFELFGQSAHPSPFEIVLSNLKVKFDLEVMYDLNFQSPITSHRKKLEDQGVYETVRLSYGHNTFSLTDAIVTESYELKWFMH